MITLHLSPDKKFSPKKSQDFLK